MSKILIKNGVVVTNRATFKSDILINNEIIEAIEKKIINKDVECTVNAKGCYLFPGGIDVHTHMELLVSETVSSDSFYSGSVAALCGGTTTIIDFANQEKGKSARDAFNLWMKKAKGECLTDFSFHVSITDVNEQTLKDVEYLFKEQGVTSFKTFLAYDAMKIPLKDLKILMKKVKQLGGIVSVHAEDGKMLEVAKDKLLNNGLLGPENHPFAHPVEAEVCAIEDIIKASKVTTCPLYIVHLSSHKGLEAIRKEKSSIIHVETCPQYLLLDAGVYENDTFLDVAKYILSPPLRKNEDRKSLWKGLRDEYIDVVATDHCPFNLSQRELGKDDFTKIPNGLPGVEERMELLFSEGVNKGRITLNQFVDMTSTMPAKIFGIPKKGELKVGAHADIVIFDPKKKGLLKAKKQITNCDNTPYEGLTLLGKVRTTILRGQIAVDKGKVLLNKGHGKYLKRKALSF